MDIFISASVFELFRITGMTRYLDNVKISQGLCKWILKLILLELNVNNKKMFSYNLSEGIQ